MIASVGRVSAALLSAFAGTAAGTRMSVAANQQGETPTSSSGVYSMGRSEDDASTLNWEQNESTSVFDSSEGTNWLSGIIEGVTQSVVVFGENNTGFLSDGLTVGTVKLDPALFSYGDSVGKTATLFSALDSLAQDVASIVPLQATVPLVLLVMAAIVFYRRNRH